MTDDERGPLAPCDALLTLPPNPVNGFLTAALPRAPKSEAPAAKVVYRTVLTLVQFLAEEGQIDAEGFERLRETIDRT